MSLRWGDICALFIALALIVWPTFGLTAAIITGICVIVILILIKYKKI
jgi:hypothetical protein